MLEIVPVGVIVFPSSGITGNLAGKQSGARSPERRVSAAFLSRHWYFLL
jgi:hypothetical protein